MAEHRGDPPGKAPASDQVPDDDEPGRLGVDDRGNITWEWAQDDELLADDSLGAMERVQALVDPGLKVQDDDEAVNTPVQSNPTGLKSGYDPYDSGALGKQTWKRKRNLKELSKWIELRKRIAQKPPEET
jgi:hypothetical protein